jgi:hypothetical protein
VQERKEATPADIEEAIRRALVSGAEYFANVWNDAGADRQVVLTAVVQRIVPPDHPRAHAWLREHDVLTTAGEFAVPLIRRWGLERDRPAREPLDASLGGGMLCGCPFPRCGGPAVAKKKQWHPVFAEMLRPLVESHFEVRTNVPVGEAPRIADILRLLRTRAGRLPFTGLLRNLTPWNVMEYKGPTVSPRTEHLHGLVEVGLGITRRLNEERQAQGGEPLPPQDVSFWYLANRLGRRLRREWARLAAGWRELGPGVWRCTVLGHLVFLVSGRDLPVEQDSLPLHLIGREPPEIERAVATFLAERPPLWEQYAEWLAAFHEDAYEEVRSMAKTTRKPFRPTLQPLIRSMGMDWVIEQVGLKRVIDEVGAKRVIDELGPKRVIDELGLKRVISEVGIDALLAELTPAQRRELKQRL